MKQRLANLPDWLKAILLVSVLALVIWVISIQLYPEWRTSRYWPFALFIAAFLASAALLDQLSGVISLFSRKTKLVQSSPKAEKSSISAYLQDRIDQWSGPRHQLDEHFVQLTLLIDQGEEATGGRFVPDETQKKYSNLRTLLAETGERNIVLLGVPGSGKSTLLRRLELEHCLIQQKMATGQLSFFVSLNEYPFPQPGQQVPEPDVWLRERWEQEKKLTPTFSHLPDFETLLGNGKLILLLDGLNELPHQGRDDYRKQVNQWQRFLHRIQRFNNIILFSCRSLDYSVLLSSDGVMVRQVRVEPLNPAKIQEFLQKYLPNMWKGPWNELKNSTKLMELYANPFYLRLLAEQVKSTSDGYVPTGRSALFTGYVRRTLRREIERNTPQFVSQQGLVTEEDHWLLANPAEWRDAYQLPEDGLLIPRLTYLAFGMQDEQKGNNGQAVTVTEERACTLLKQGANGTHANADVRVLLPTTVRQELMAPLPKLEHSAQMEGLISIEQAKQIIDAGVALAILDRVRADRKLKFFHQLLQEFFAARLLAYQPAPSRVWVGWRENEVTPSLQVELNRITVSDPLPKLESTGWEETTLMASEMTTNPNEFLKGLMPANLPLAARCAALPSVAVSEDLKHELQQALLARIASPETDLRARIAAAEALGELGDPRFERREGEFGEYLLPQTVPVAGGIYPIGDNKSQYSQEKPAHTVQVAPFAMGMFPVTNAEYALFVIAGGYEDERWWQTDAARAWLRGKSNDDAKQGAFRHQTYLKSISEDSIRHRQASADEIEFLLWLRNASSLEIEEEYNKRLPADSSYRNPRYWDNSAFNHVSQPVVGVCLFEAMAYSAWLSAQTGIVYELPSEVEWEAAARGQTDWKYSYGPTYNAANCNTFETHIRRTTPVGVFPEGKTPKGIADMSGNVWEWTTTLWGDKWQQSSFDYPYNATDGREDVTAGVTLRIVRGGAWDFDQKSATVTYRGRGNPYGRLTYFGFRLLRRPVS